MGLLDGPSGHFIHGNFLTRMALCAQSQLFMALLLFLLFGWIRICSNQVAIQVLGSELLKVEVDGSQYCNLKKVYFGNYYNNDNNNNSNTVIIITITTSLDRYDTQALLYSLANLTLKAD